MDLRTSNNLANANLCPEQSIPAAYGRVESGRHELGSNEDGKGVDQQDAYCLPLWWSLAASS